MRKTSVFFSSVAAAFWIASGTPLFAVDSPALNLARQLNEAFIQVADTVSSSVVVIEVREKVTDDEDSNDAAAPNDRPHRRNRKKNSRQHYVEGEGSGIVVTEDGYILTNDHVVENADKILVRFKDGRTFDGEVKGADPQSDVAVVKIKAKGLKTAKLGDSDATRVGEFVLAIGAPFSLSYSVTVGHVSAKGRSFEELTPGYSDQDFLQTDASINPGNSGGPLVNLYGEVIAINTMIEGMNTGIGFAVPINLAKRVMAHLISEGKFTRSWLGIGIRELRDFRSYQDIDKDLSPDADNGIVVTGIMVNGPASKSKLRVGDVIISVNGKAVETARQLKDAISMATPGHTLTLNVIRARDHMTIKVKAEMLPVENSVAAGHGRQQEDRNMEAATFGLTLEGLTKDLADQSGVELGAGVIVTAVDRDSPGDDAGIVAGDVIIEVNRQRITSLKQFVQIMKGTDPKKSVMLNLISNGSTRLAIIKPEAE